MTLGMTMQRIAVEIVFPDPDAMARGTAALIEQGFEVRHLDQHFDPAGSLATWALAWTLTLLDESELLSLVQDLVSPLGGTADMAGAVSDDELAQWLAHETPISRFVEPTRKPS